MKRKIGIIAVAVLFSAAFAQSANWGTIKTPGDWTADAATHWDAGEPGAGEIANLWDGTCTISSGNNEVANELRLGNSPGYAPTLNVAGGSLAHGAAHVGYFTAGTLNITSGSVDSSTMIVNAGGLAAVSGSGSWTGSSFLIVGNNSTGTLNITGGGSVANTYSLLGRLANGNGAVSVSGSGSTWVNSGTIQLGANSIGLLNVTAGGTVSSVGTSYVGANAGGGSGTATISGTGSVWENDGVLRVGWNGTGALIISDGGRVVVNGLTVDAAGAGGYVNMYTAGELALLDAADAGSVNITAFLGLVSGTDEIRYWNGSVWDQIANATAGIDYTLTHYTAGNLANHTVLTVLTSAPFANWLVGSGDWGTGANWDIGEPEFTTDANISNGGTSTVTQAGEACDDLWLGYSAAQSGTLEIKGGDLAIAGGTLIGNQGSGTMNITSGTVSSVATVQIGSGATGSGMVSVDGANSKWTLDGDLYVGYDGAATLAITNGGLVAVGDMLTIDSNFATTVDAHIQMSTDGTLALYDAADIGSSNITVFLSLIGGSDDLRYWNGSAWSHITNGVKSLDYTLSHHYTGELADYTVLQLSREDLNVAELPLQDVMGMADQILTPLEQLDILLPPLPAVSNKIAVLRFRAVSHTDSSAGWGWNAAFAMNGTSLRQYTSAGDPRLIGRESSFFTRDQYWDVFSGYMVRLMFAPNVDIGDSMIPDGQGASFAFDISDVVSGVESNTLRISNLSLTQDMIVREIEIGWLDKVLVPEPVNRLPSREPMAASVSKGGLELFQGTAGGFSVKGSSGVELMVETALTLDHEAESNLPATDGTATGATIVVSQEGAFGYRVEATWTNLNLSLDRRTWLDNGELHWTDEWTNTSAVAVALPFRHHVFLRNEPEATFYMAGNVNSETIQSVARNPTIFIDSKTNLGYGAGITMESDWLRLLAGLRHSGGVGEIYSETASLPAGGNISFTQTVSLVEDGGGYWTFINDVRKRWGVNGGTAERPFFWNWAGKDIPMTTEHWINAFGHLGPVVVTAWPTRHPYIRIGFDLAALEDYPKLPTNAPPTSGLMPDFDVDTWLTFDHREAYWSECSNAVALLHGALPNAQVVYMCHPGLEAIYRPLADSWPQADEAILDADGNLFNSIYYSAAFLGDFADQDWQMSYNAPRSNSVYQSILLRDIARIMDECGADGVYMDEFSWAGSTRGYSRYDYGRQDGYSADINADGSVGLLKSDNAYTTEDTQLQIVNAVKNRGKFLLGNGNAALRSINNLHALYFSEGGNGAGTWVGAHLATVPLILGNFGDRSSTRKGVFQSVKAVVENGCIYSPTGCNLVLEGDDNFVCKQYPITIQNIGPGVVKAEERLITTHSGTFDWPGRNATVTLYAYDENGDLMNSNNLPVVQVDANSLLNITVPPDGMVIAEASRPSSGLHVILLGGD